MNSTWALFRSDRFYLTKYFAAHTAILILLSLFLLKLQGLTWHFKYSPVYLLCFPLSIIMGIQVPVLMHNCMHGNLKSKTANLIYGELSGFFALMSLGILRINHTLHHAFSDTINDPHDPSEKSFWKFFFTSQLTGARIIEEKFLEYHGRSNFNKVLFKLNIAVHYGSHILRLFVWYLLLGPEMFVFLYIPSFIVYSLAFAHVNYITHARNEKGETEILNKNDNFYYKFINFIGSGVYFHKNHHEHPKLLNPMYLGNKETV